MGKSLKELTIIFLLVIVMLFIGTTISNAAEEMDFKWSTIKKYADDFLKKGEEGADYINQKSLTGLVTGLGGILTTIGAVIVLIGFLVMGIQYMMATPDEAAKLKTKLVGLAVAGIVILGAWGIWNLTLKFLSGVTAITN